MAVLAQEDWIQAIIIVVAVVVVLVLHIRLLSLLGQVEHRTVVAEGMEPLLRLCPVSTVVTVAVGAVLDQR